MTTQPTNAYDQATQQAFITRLIRLSPRQRGILRRNLQQHIYEASGCHVLFARLAGDTDTWSGRARNDYFLVATLASILSPKTPHGVGDFGWSLRQLKVSYGDPLTQRVEQLLNAERADLTHELTALAQSIALKSIPVSLPILLADILNWTARTGTVQSRWANHFLHKEL